jgi:hypothetical protein
MTFYKRIMKRIIIFTIILFFAGKAGIQAQDQEEMDKLTAYKIAFFTKKLDFTPAEAEKFWPVYNDYTARKSKIQIDRLSMMRYVKQNEALISEQEITATADKLVQTYIDESNLTISFTTEIRKILPPAKVIKLFQAESQYKQQLLQELNARRQTNANGPVRRFNR